MSPATNAREFWSSIHFSGPTGQSLRNSNSRILPEHNDLHNRDQLRMVSYPLGQSTSRNMYTSLLQDIVEESTSHGQRKTRSGSEGCTYLHEFCSLPHQQLNAAWRCGLAQTSQDVVVPSERLGNASDSLGVNGLPCSGASDDGNRRDRDRQLDSSFTESLDLVPSSPTSENPPPDASLSGSIEQSMPLQLYDHCASSQHEDPAQILAEDFSLNCSRVGPCHLGNSGSPSFSSDPCWDQWASLRRDDLALVAKAIESRLRPNLGLDCNMSGLTDGESVFNTQREQSLSPLPSVIAGHNALAPDVHASDSQSHAYIACGDLTQLHRPREEDIQAFFDRSVGGSSLLRTGLDQNVTSHMEQKSESGTGVTQKATGMRTVRRGSKLRSTKRRRSRESHDFEIDHQRMTHIVVERNRRKQMNQHLAALKALMPVSYVYKSDQASIVGAAIEFVRELEMLQDSLQSTLKRRTFAHALDQSRASSRALPVEHGASSSSQALGPAENCHVQDRNSFSPAPKAHFGFDQLGSHGHCTELEHLVHAVVPELKAESTSPAATIEMKTVGSNAIVNIMTPWRAKQLVQVILAIESLFFNIMHVNITTYNDIVLYTFNVQMLSTSEMPVDQIVAALQKTFNLLHCIPA